MELFRPARKDLAVFVLTVPMSSQNAYGHARVWLS